MLGVHDYILFLFLIIAFISDIKNQKLPNWLTAGGIVIGIIYHFITDGFGGLLFSLLGLLTAGGIFLILYIFKAIGAGDVKLFGAIGSLVGFDMVVNMMVLSIVFAGILSALILLLTKTFMKKMIDAFFYLRDSLYMKDYRKLEDYKKNKATRFPFMYAVVPAVVITYIYPII